MSPDPEQGRRGAAPRAPLVLYAVAFLLLLASGGSLVLAVRGFLQDLWPLWLSGGCSVAAVVAAIASWAAARRR